MMCGFFARELEDGARLRRAARVVARARLLRLRRPAVGEVAVEVVEVVGEEVGVRDAPAVEVDDAALGIELVEGALVLRQARHHHRRVEGQAVLAAQLHQLAIGARLAHVARLAVAVDVGRLPERVVLVGAVVHRARADVAALLEHFLGAVGRDARDHVEERLPDRIGHVLRQGLAARLVLALVDGEDVLGHGQRHARAADLGGVHVAVDPDGRADLVGVRCRSSGSGCRGLRRTCRWSPGGRGRGAAWTRRRVGRRVRRSRGIWCGTFFFLRERGARADIMDPRGRLRTRPDWLPARLGVH